MSQPDDSEDKPHEATVRKLENARKKGDLAKSNDMLTASAYLGLLLAGYSIGGSALESLGGLLQSFLEAAEDTSRNSIGHTRAELVSTGMAREIVATVGPWFIFPALIVIAAAQLQQAWVFSPDRLRPKLSRVSPISNAKNKFGRSGMFEFAKSALKLFVYSLVLAGFLYRERNEIFGSVNIDSREGTVLLFQATLKFTGVVTLTAFLIATVDYLWQRSDWLRRNRMSDKELRDEVKESEGDPYMKQTRRQRGQQMALAQIAANVPKADVVIVNPTHFAVALSWDRGKASAPVVEAKGADELAARIREIAKECGIPIRQDAPTARALFETVPVGHEISEVHYKPVALAIRFADRMRRSRGRFSN